MATKKASPAQIAARKLFAQRAKAGTLKKSSVKFNVTRKKNPIKPKRAVKRHVRKIPVGETYEFPGTLYLVESSKDKKSWEFVSAHQGPGYAKGRAEMIAEEYPHHYIRVRDIRVQE